MTGISCFIYGFGTYNWVVLESVYALFLLQFSIPHHFCL